MSTKYTDDFLLGELNRYYAENNTVPIKNKFKASSGYVSSWVIVNRFGSWNNALELANLPVNIKQTKNNYWNRDYIIAYTNGYIKKYNKYPNSKAPGAPSISTVKKYFTSWVDVFNNSDYPKKEWTKDSIKLTIIDFYNTFNRCPTSKDFRANTVKYPASSVIDNIYGSWNAAIEDAGFDISRYNGYGRVTKGLDGAHYRSTAEAYFSDNFLYKKYCYIIEPKYPEPYNKFYDWYIKDLNLYIELDGGLRPEIVKEKITINKLLNRTCLFINIKDIYDSTYIEDILNKTKETI